VGLALVGLAQAPEHVLVGRLLHSIGGGPNSAAIAMAGSLVPTSHIGLGMGLLQTGVSLGQSVGPVVGGFVGDAFGFRNAFFGAAALTGVVGLLVMLVVREPPRPSATDTAEPFFRGVSYVVKDDHLRHLDGLLFLSWLFTQPRPTIFSLNPRNLGRYIRKTPICASRRCPASTPRAAAEALLELVLDAMRDIVEYTEAVVMLVEGDQLCVAAYRGQSRPSDGVRIPMPDAVIIQAVLRHRGAVVVDDLLGDDPLAHEYRRAVARLRDSRPQAVRSVLSVPLTVKDIIIGQLRFDHAHAGFYGSRHADLAAAMARGVRGERPFPYGFGAEAAAPVLVIRRTDPLGDVPNSRAFWPWATHIVRRDARVRAGGPTSWATLARCPLLLSGWARPALCAQQNLFRHRRRRSRARS